MQVGNGWQRTHGARWWMVVAQLAAIGGCEGAPGSDPEFEARQQRASELVAAHCASTDDCACTRTAAQAGCEGVLGDTWRARINAGTARGLTYDAACIDAIEAAIDEVQCSWPAEGEANPCADFCQVFHGERALGERCEGFDALVSDCAQGLTCADGRCVAACERLSGQPEGGACVEPSSGTALDRCAEGLTCLSQTGRCARAPAAGQPCLAGECEPQSYCNWSGVEPICSPRAGEGANCDYAPCQHGLNCVWNDADYTAQCRRRAGEGEPCNEAGCDEGLTCDAEGRCAPPAELGQPCAWLPCREGLLCNFSNYTCVEPPGAGQPCPEGECARGNFCDGTTGWCVAGLPLAAPCTGHLQCASAYCPAGFCDERPAIGESCAGSFVCEIGASCDGQLCRASMTRGPAVCVYEGW